jgi:uncharacterized peroxidase-related enzyme
MDLRAEARELEEEAREALVNGVGSDWRQARLDPVDAALCAFAEKLTRTPAAMTEADVETLRSNGLDDEGISSAVQVVSYFNYINRVADAVHVDLEPEMDPYPES